MARSRSTALELNNPVNKIDLLRCPVAHGRTQVVGRPVRAIAVAGMPIQVLANLGAAGEPFCNVGVGRNAPAHISAGAYKIPLTKSNLARLVPVRG